MSSIENTRVLIAGINQFINTVITYINVNTRTNFNDMLCSRERACVDFSEEETRVTYATIVEGLLATHLKGINTQMECTNYPTATSVAEHLLQATRRGMVDNSWAEMFETMEFYGVSLSTVDPRKCPDTTLMFESYPRSRALKVVREYIARSSRHTC